MSILTEELQYIWDWLEDINPEPDFYDFKCYQPGLSRKQISSLTKDLPFSLPEEICQLYEWTNGLKDYCDDVQINFLFLDPQDSTPLNLYPLHIAVQVYRELCKSAQMGAELGCELWNKSWFPIAEFNTEVHLYVDLTSSPSPITKRDFILRQNIRTYKSLTAMISVIAECCEMDVYHIVPDEYYPEDYVRIKIDEKKRSLENEIFQKYNS